MNNITQIKRGSTASWSLGPEMVHWEDLNVQGKDGLIHCEGTDLQMKVYTTSADYFYDENGQLEDIKSPGLWLIQPGEINWDASAQVEFKCWTNGPSDCWLEVAAPNAPSVHGQKIPLGRQAQMTVPYIGDWGLYIRWPEQREDIGTADIKISIREVNACEELAPGQLGLEYTEDGQVKLKAGMPNKSKWDELPYIGSEKAVDWDVAEESNPAAIKNKPFGLIEQMVDILPEAEYHFYRPTETTTDIIGNTPGFNSDSEYAVWFNDAYLGASKPGERLAIPNGQFSFGSGAMVIYGGNYPEGKYKVRITEKQVVPKKLDSQWLNLCTNSNDLYDNLNPVTGNLLAQVRSEVGTWQSTLHGRIDNVIIPAIGSVPTPGDNGKLLQVVDGKPTWAEVSGDGDTKVLVVTAEWDEENEYYKASHTSKQIYDHVQSGGIVALSVDGTLYNLYRASEGGTTLFTIADDLICTICEINDARKCSFYDLTLASWESIHDELKRVITVDKNDVPSMTSQEIYNLVQYGGRVVLNYDDRVYSLASCESSSAYFNYYDETHTIYCIEIHDNKVFKWPDFAPASMDWVGEQLGPINEALDDLKDKVLPTATTADEGKLLQVVNGAWAAVSITNGNEVAY